MIKNNKINFLYLISKRAINLIIFLMVIFDSYLSVYPILLKCYGIIQNNWNFNTWHDAIVLFGIIDIPRFFMGLFLFFMAFILMLKTRLSWILTLLTLFCLIFVDKIIIRNNNNNYIYFLVTILFLLSSWKDFYRRSLGSISLISTISILFLLSYGVLGSLYLGSQFSPRIENAYSAIYFVIVCMSTVGFGDIVPTTDESRLFTLTLIIFGITIFTASVASVGGSIIRNNVKKITNGKILKVSRNNHCVIIGSSYFSRSICEKIIKSGLEITIICKKEDMGLFSKNIDLVEEDSQFSTSLKQANAEDAKYVISLMENDSDNAFAILSAKEICNSSTKIISLVNEFSNINKIKTLHPDGILSLQNLGAEIITRLINKEPIDESIINVFFNGNINNEN